MVCDLVPITDENAKRVLDDRDWRPTHALAHHGQLTVLDLTRKILDAMGSSLEPDVRADARAEIGHQWLSAAKAREQLAWAPAFDLESGLARTIPWYKEYLTRGR